MYLFVLVSALLLQTAALPPVPSQLVEIQTLIDRNELKEAESKAHAFISANPTAADGHYLLGYVLLRSGHPRESLSEYQEGAKYREPHALDLAAMGGDAFLLEDYAAADQWFTKSVEKDDSSAAVWYQLGRTKYNEKRFAEAVASLEHSLKLRPLDARAQDYLGLSLQHLGKAEEALAAFRKAIDLDPASDSTYLNLGTLLLDNNRATDAISALSRAVELAPQNAEAHRALGKAYLTVNKLELAQAEVEKAVGLAPDQAPIHFLLAQVYRKRGLTAQADAETARYAELTGTHSAPETPLTEARSLVDLGKLSEAEKAVRGYLRQHPHSGEAHFLLGYILFKEQNAIPSLAEYTEGAKYRKPLSSDLEVVASDYVLLKDYPDADKWYTKAVEWSPEDPLGWYYLGRTKYNENRFDEAVSVFQKCLTLRPRNVKAEDNLGLSYEGLNQTDEALAAYRTAIAWQADAFEKDAGPFLNLGSLLVESGKAEEGLPHLLEAAKLTPGDFRMHRALGKAYAHLDQQSNAREELETAAGLAPDDAPIHFMLAQVYRKLGMAEKAKIESEVYTKLTGAASTLVK